MQESKCFEIFKSCIRAIRDGKLICQESSRDKEFHFQNWCQNRIEEAGLRYESGGRNGFPDFRLVEFTEGYEIKGLAYPGRERNFDANSNLPTGFHNGRQIFYIFGRYPSNNNEYRTMDKYEYPVIDLVICHGDFLNAQHDYVHKNQHVSGFGSYGDIMIRDRKMYVVPTPFALTVGTTGLCTLIVPEDYPATEEFICVGDFTRIETDKIVTGYSFNLQDNTIEAKRSNNPQTLKKHNFKAFRHNSQTSKPVTMR
jgi:hypothetical protein